MSSYTDADKLELSRMTEQITLDTWLSKVLKYINNQNKSETLSAKKLTAIILCKQRHSADIYIHYGANSRQNTPDF